MRLETVRNDLMLHEGFKSEAYQDHLGYWTIGYGRLIDKRKGGGITPDEAGMLLDNDITRVYNQLSKQVQFFDKLPSQVQRALINMTFQMGINGVLNFRKMWAALERRDYPKAAVEALDSTWAKQTPKRAKEVTEWIRWAQ